MGDLDWRARQVAGLFVRLFGCDGRPFGSKSLHQRGVSDGVEGVQWNAGCYADEETAWLGVNLEGMKYDDWPVSRLIERELSHPLLLKEYRPRVALPGKVRVTWTRDAWQAAIRVRTEGRRLPPTPITLDQLDTDGWDRALQAARECLDPKRNYRGRHLVEVTLLPSRRRVKRGVTPHLAFKHWLPETTMDAMRQAKGNLEALHEFATRQARSWGA